MTGARARSRLGKRRLATITRYIAISALVGCASTGFIPLDRLATHTHAGAIAWWYGNDTSTVGAGDPALIGLINQKCAVRKMGGEKSAFFLRAAAYANRAITSHAFATILSAKTSFEHTSDTGSQVMERLRWGGAQINVFMYSRDGDHPCHDNDLVDGHTNAFTPMPRDRDVRLLFLYEPYLLRAMNTKAVRDVARTLVHESLHSLGYSHAGLDVGSEAYNNTAPLYVACLVEHWGNDVAQEWIRNNCHKANEARDPWEPPIGDR